MVRATNHRVFQGRLRHVQALKRIARNRVQQFLGRPPIQLREGPQRLMFERLGILSIFPPDGFVVLAVRTDGVCASVVYVGLVGRLGRRDAGRGGVYRGLVGGEVGQRVPMFASLFASEVIARWQNTLRELMYRILAASVMSKASVGLHHWV